MNLSNVEIEKVSSQLSEQGFVYLESLGEQFNYIEFVQNFGKLSTQYDGDAIWTIQSNDKFKDVYHSMNNQELFPHTEYYESQGLPPRYLALWCVNPGNTGEGFTYLADTYPFFHSIEDDALVEKLSRIPLRYSSTEGLKLENHHLDAYHSILEKSDSGDLIVRYSSRCMHTSKNKDVHNAIEDLKQHIDNNIEKIQWKKHSLLIWDNYRMVHSRSAFINANRELKRLWISN
ncbi:TauD/TfdA family dioxygenase [Vibrio sp. NTOU-M3]|uniref:TauD/TfdA family dioxygenase n=1 Tax=Vibrio sp. NTOU-M3 TaxID=3234954 RepID=UPI00349F55AF